MTTTNEIFNKKTSSSELKGADCFNITCSSNKESYTIQFPGETTNEEFICTKAKETLILEKYSFKIFCADPDVICNTQSPCANDCSSK